MTARAPVVFAGGLQQLQAGDTLAGFSATKASLPTSKLVANTLTQVLGFTAPANSIPAGTTFTFDLVGLLTNTTAASSSALTLRINAASLGVVIEASFTVALGVTARTNCPFALTGMISVQTAGAGGTAIGAIVITLNSTTPLALPTTIVTAPVAINTTQANVVELTCISGAATSTWNFLAGLLVQD